jgi:hypothetical protein
MSLSSAIHALLKNLGASQMRSAAYDTAWAARLTALDEPLGWHALEWLRANQLPDGSWGAGEFCYHHDRFVCTLAALTALARIDTPQDQCRIKRGLTAFNTLITGLRADLAGETVGFEVIIPTLVAEAHELDVLRRRSDALDSLVNREVLVKDDETPHRRSEDAYLQRLIEHRAAKLARLPNGSINRNVSLAFSAEMAGPQGGNLFDLTHLLESNGSVGHSPAATAYYALYLQPDNPVALHYLRQIAAAQGDGGLPEFAPLDIFETSWALWNLTLAGQLSPEQVALCQPHLDFLQKAWQPNVGVGLSTSYSVADGDDTAITYEILMRHGRLATIEALWHYEASDHFRSMPLEFTRSTSANIHVLSALKAAGYTADFPAVKKVVRFLRNTQMAQMYWVDKWQVSPYYTTAHAILALTEVDDALAQSACDWILETQRPSGAWGFYLPTAEETAYCLQALTLWKRASGAAPKAAIRRGYEWLAAHLDNPAPTPYPPLWICKCLYSPTLIIRAAILSALMLGEQEGYPLPHNL